MNPVAQGTQRDARWDELTTAETRVLKRLRKRFHELCDDELRALIRDAQLDLIEKWEAGQIAWPANPAAWLEQAARRDGLDHLKTTRRRATKAAGAPDTDYWAGIAPAAEAEHDRVLAEESARGLYALLSPTQRQIAVLRFSADLEPQVIAKQLKLSRRAVYKHLDAMTSRLQVPAGELVDGEFPTAWRELVSGHVAGTLPPRDQAKATALLQANSDAQLFALGLQRAGEQLAALVPPAALLAAPERTNPLARIADRIGDFAMGVRDAIENAAAAVKHQVASLLGRAAETVPTLATSRSGAGALLASCVLASGGTVCVITGTTPNDLADIFGQQQKPKTARKAPKRKAAHAPVTATAPPTPPPRSRRKAPVAQAPTRQRTPTPAANQASPTPVPPTVTGDFGAQPEAPAQPAPAPIDGPGDFGP